MGAPVPDPDTAGRDAVRDTLALVLACFTQKGHPGMPCLRTGWMPVGLVEHWRSVLAADRPSPPEASPDASESARSSADDHTGREALDSLDLLRRMALDGCNDVGRTVIHGAVTRVLAALSRSPERATAGEVTDDDWREAAKVYEDDPGLLVGLMAPPAAALPAPAAEHRDADDDALQCVDCAETDRLFHDVARQRDEARGVLRRVEALCDEAEKHADTYKSTCLLTTGQVRAALSGEAETP